MLKFFLSFLGFFWSSRPPFFISFPRSPLSPNLWDWSFICYLCHVFSYLLHFLCQHTQSLSKASVCCGIVEPWTYRTVSLPYWAFHRWPSYFLEVCSMVRSCNITQWSFATFMAFRYFPLPTRKEQIIRHLHWKTKLKPYKLHLLYIECWEYNSRCFLFHPAIPP